MRKFKSYFSVILVALMLTGLFAISAQATGGSTTSLSPSSPGMKAYYDFEITGEKYHDASNSGNQTTTRSELTTFRANTFSLPTSPVDYRNFFVRTDQAGRLLGIYDKTNDSITPYQGNKALKLTIPLDSGFGIGNVSYTAKKLYLFSTTIKLSGDNEGIVSPAVDAAPRWGLVFKPVFKSNSGNVVTSGGRLYVYSALEGFKDCSESVDGNIRNYPDDLVLKVENADNWTTANRVFYFTESTNTQAVGMGSDDSSYKRTKNIYVDETYIREFFAGIDGDAAITVSRSITNGSALEAASAATKTYSVIKASSIELNPTIEWSLEGTPSGISIDASTGVLTVQPYADATAVTVKARVYTKDSSDVILTDETLTKTVAITYTGDAIPYVTNAHIISNLNGIEGVQSGETIEVDWTFMKPSSLSGSDASTVRWLVSDSSDVNGTYTEQSSVSGQPKQFAVLSTHGGKWIKTEITPKVSDGMATVTNATLVYTVPVSPAVIPEAKDAYIDGEHKVGSEIEGKYTYIDANYISDLDTPLEAEDKTASGSVYEWYRYDNESDVTPNPVTPIATTKKYTITEDDIGKFLEFRVKVKNAGGEEATDYAVSATKFRGPVPPVAQGVSITGSTALGGTLTGNYTYYSEIGSESDEPVYSWKMDGREISNNASITVTSDMNGKTLEFTVIPMAYDEPKEGAPVSATIYVSFTSDNYGYTGPSIGSSFGPLPTPPKEELPEVIAPKPEVVEPTPSASGFTDVKGHWAEETITNMTSKEVLNGYEDKTFKPDASIKRNETVTMIVKAFGIQEKDTDEVFTDVKDDSWYYSAVKTAIANGIVKGYNGMFLPENNITRQEFAVIITNVLNLYPDASIETEEKEEFADSSEIADWAKEAVNKLNSMNIMQGFEGNFSPNAPLTRAEAATTVERLYNILGIK